MNIAFKNGFWSLGIFGVLVLLFLSECQLGISRIGVSLQSHLASSGSDKYA